MFTDATDDGLTVALRTTLAAIRELGAHATAGEIAKRFTISQNGGHFRIARAKKKKLVEPTGERFAGAIVYRLSEKGEALLSKAG